MNEPEIGRRFPAHPPPVERYKEPIIVYLTVCSKGRKRIFAFADSAAAIVNAWQNANSWLVGRYVIMPDHIHLFCAPNTFPIRPLKQWVRYWKARASQRWPRLKEHPIWQQECCDTQLRRHENYDAKWEYVINNPVRAALVKEPDDWPFQGELNILRW